MFRRMDGREICVAQCPDPTFQGVEIQRVAAANRGRCLAHSSRRKLSPAAFQADEHPLLPQYATYFRQGLLMRQERQNSFAHDCIEHRIAKPKIVDISNFAPDPIPQPELFYESLCGVYRARGNVDGRNLAAVLLGDLAGGLPESPANFENMQIWARLDAIYYLLAAGQSSGI